VRSGLEHIAAGQLGILLIKPLATEHAQPLGIDAIDHAADGGPEDRAGTHHARLGRRVQRGDGQLIAGMQGAGQADGGQLGMGRAIAALAVGIAGPGQHASVGRHDQRAKRPVAALARRIGKRNGFTQIAAIAVIQGLGLRQGHGGFLLRP